MRNNPTSDLDNVLPSLTSDLSLPQTTPTILPGSTGKSHHQVEDKPTITHINITDSQPDNSSNYTESYLEDFLDSLANISDASHQDMDLRDSPHMTMPPPSQQQKEQQTNVNVGVVVTVVAVAMLALIISVGVIKEYRHLKFKGWRFVHSGERDATIGVKPSGSTVRREKKGVTKKKKKMTPYNKLQSVLGASKLGFSRLKTYDSDSEEEEFPVFNRV